MNRFSILCLYVVVLLVSFEYVTCRCGDDGLWQNLDDAERLWGVTIQCQSTGNQEPSLVMKLKQLSCPHLDGSLKDAYIIYEVNNEGDPSFELVAVPGNEATTSDGKNTGNKIAISIAKHPLTNIFISTINKERNELEMRDIDVSDSLLHYYKMTFNDYDQAKDVHNKYAERVSLGRAPKPSNAQ